jgi:hydroxymethylglutaryl-CoA lyase
MAFPSKVRIVEVGPRDGLQNEAAIIPVDVKVRLIDRLTDSGLQTIEAGSFVSPKWVPQMADTAEVLRRIRRRDGVTHPVLVPNLIGLEAALASGAQEVAVFASASETFSLRNINCSIEDSLRRFEPVVERARSAGMKVRGYVSCVLGSPYGDEVTPTMVAEVATRLAGLGCYEISLGDTIGCGMPDTAVRMVQAVIDRLAPERLALHFHDTNRQALANIAACLPLGVSVLDAAVGGLGGCPYAPGASGNVATEDLLVMLHRLGIDTGVDLDAVAEAAGYVSMSLGREPRSSYRAAKQATF